HVHSHHHSCPLRTSSLTSSFCCFFSCSVHHPDLHSFPTRRSSDLLLNSTATARRRQRTGWPRSSKYRSPDDPRPRSSDHAEADRSEEHTSELQSHLNLVCRLLLEKKKQRTLRIVT